MRVAYALQGDTVDLVSQRCYGATTMVVAILKANPGLAACGPILPMGTRIMLPPALPAIVKTHNLWE